MTRVQAIRIALIALAVGLLAWGLLGERHRILPLVGEAQPLIADGLRFTEDATVDGYVRIRGELFDAYTPLTPGQVQLKDCKT
jgi:hypothetical protein